MTPPQMIKDMTVRGLAENTRKSYVSSVSGLARHYGRSPNRTSIPELPRGPCDRRGRLSQLYRGTLLWQIAREFVQPGWNPERQAVRHVRNGVASTT